MQYLACDLPHMMTAYRRCVFVALVRGSVTLNHEINMKIIFIATLLAAASSVLSGCIVDERRGERGYSEGRYEQRQDRYDERRREDRGDRERRYDR
jgi:hypothetical protein